MRSEDTAKILTPVQLQGNDNFKEMNHELEEDKEYAHEEARESVFYFKCTAT